MIRMAVRAATRMMVMNISMAMLTTHVLGMKMVTAATLGKVIRMKMM